MLAPWEAGLCSEKLLPKLGKDNLAALASLLWFLLRKVYPALPQGTKPLPTDKLSKHDESVAASKPAGGLLKSFQVCRN